MRILVCENDLLVKTIIWKILVGAGHHVETAIDGQDALEKIQKNQNKFDLLITDNNMPRLTGIELVEKLRALKPQLKVIMSSSAISPLEAGTRNRLQLSGILYKPFKVTDLLDCLNMLLISRRIDLKGLRACLN